jgi:hypothetical protein
MASVKTRGVGNNKSEAQTRLKLEESTKTQEYGVALGGSESRDQTSVVP